MATSVDQAWRGCLGLAIREVTLSSQARGGQVIRKTLVGKEGMRLRHTAQI